MLPRTPNSLLRTELDTTAYEEDESLLVSPVQLPKSIDTSLPNKVTTFDPETPELQSEKSEMLVYEDEKVEELIMPSCNSPINERQGLPLSDSTEAENDHFESTPKSPQHLAS